MGMRQSFWSNSTGRFSDLLCKMWCSFFHSSCLKHFLSTISAPAEGLLWCLLCRPHQTFSTGPCDCHSGFQLLTCTACRAGGAAVHFALCTLQPGPSVNILRFLKKKKNYKTHMEIPDRSFLQTLGSCKGTYEDIHFLHWCLYCWQKEAALFIPR